MFAFASPLWLLGLLPLSAACVYLLWGRRKRRDVPFLELWRGPAAVERAKWKVAAPPVALALAILSLLTALLGTARPGGRWGASAARDGGAVTVLLDRGITMSGRGKADLRFREAGRAAAEAVTNELGRDAAVRVATVPPARTASTDEPMPEIYANPAAWSGALAGIPPTASDTRDLLRILLRRLLAGTDGPVLVVTDGDLSIAGPDARRVVRVPPATALRNVGIALLAARPTPRPQVMVRVRNDSALGTAELRVSAGSGADGIERRPIALPPAGSERDYFFNPPRLGAEISAELIADDDLPADNKAWLVRESSWPLVELARPAGALQRLVDVYRKVRPPGDSSRRLRVVDQPDALAADQSGVVLAAEPPADAPLVRPTRVEPHPVTDAVRNWAAQDLSAAAGAKPPSGWAVVLAANDQPLLAVHESSAADGPARQVWVGIGAGRWADRPEYVAFWTAVFDWAGAAAGEAYASYPLDQFDPSWHPVPEPGPPRVPGEWPGLYERAGEAPDARPSRRAFNASVVRTPPDAISNEAWRRQLQSLKPSAPGWHDWTPAALLAALACSLFAAATWRRGSKS